MLFCKFYICYFYLFVCLFIHLVIYFVFLPRGCPPPFLPRWGLLPVGPRPPRRRARHRRTTTPTDSELADPRPGAVEAAGPAASLAGNRVRMKLVRNSPKVLLCGIFRNEMMLCHTVKHRFSVVFTGGVVCLLPPQKKLNCKFFRGYFGYFTHFFPAPILFEPILMSAQSSLPDISVFICPV